MGSHLASGIVKSTPRKVIGSYSGKPHWVVDYEDPKIARAQAEIFRTEGAALRFIERAKKTGRIEK